MTSDDGLKPLLDGEPVIVEHDGLRVAARYRRGSSDRLIVLFHAALDEQPTRAPHLQRFLPIDAHQLSVGDPTLLLDRALQCCWYLGAEGQDLPARLSAFIGRVATALGAGPRIYVGGSSGGFAALLYSRLDAGSLAVAACPQTSLLSYDSTGKDRFIRWCWPAAEAAKDVSLLPYADLCRLYRGRIENFVVLLLSPSDPHHLYKHMGPFLKSLSAGTRDRLALDVSFHGKHGHGSSVPPSAILPWVRAALVSPTLGPRDILDARATLVADARPAPVSASVASRKDDPGPSDADLRMAALLGRLQLSA